MEPRIEETDTGSLADNSSVASSDSNYLLDLADETEYEDILPKTNYHSPYYVNVPTPKHSLLAGAGANSASAGANSGAGNANISARAGANVGVGSGAGASANAGKAEGLDLYDDGTASFVREYPTDILADRFHKWRKILKAMIIYLREVAYSQEQFARINYSLKNSVKFSFLTDLDESTNRVSDPLTKNLPQKKPQPMTQMKSPFDEKPDPFAASNASTLNNSSIDLGQELQLEPNDSCSGAGFMNFGSGSIQDIQVILKKYHLSLASQQVKSSKEITLQIIPKLEDLRKDLSHKIKEIKELNADFKTNIQEHVALTGQLLHKYIAAVNFLNDNASRSDLIKLKRNSSLKSKHDPYLLKLQLDLQLKRQLLEENYLQEAYINLQSSGMELEKIIFSTIQKTLQKFSAIIDVQARTSINNLCRELQRGILSKPPCVEWDNFVSHHPRCLLNWKSTDPIPQPRKLSDIRYPKMKSSLAKCIRAGYLLKKSKYLKQYNKGYFVLTSNFLHEFKSSNFFKLTQDTGENSEHAIIPSSGNKGRSIIPIMSISLNESELLEIEDKFTINCKSTYIMEESASESISNDLKKISKSTSTISKLFKPGSGKHGKNNNLAMGSSNDSRVVSGGDDTVKFTSITFKRPADVDVKEFKKWTNNLKDLTKFHNTLDRARYIEEKILKAHNKFASSTLSLGQSKSEPTSSLHLSSQSSSNLQQRPHYIQLPSVSQVNLRSKVNTPAIDDNGNLIFATERPKSLAPTIEARPPPTELPSHQVSPTSFISNDGSSGSNKTSNMGYVITSNGMTPVHHLTPLTHVRTTSGDAGNTTNHTGAEFNFFMSPKDISGNVTSASNTSSGSGGGYFAIPVKSTSQHSTPTGEGSRTPNAIPKIHINELEAPHPAKVIPLNHTPETSTSRNIPYNNLKKNSSASSVPSVSSLRAASPILSNPLHNLSTPALQGGKQSQTQPVRKHKKTVSFNSLNSLMFSKKAPTPVNSQYLSDAKINEDDDPNAINIHESLYS